MKNNDINYYIATVIYCAVFGFFAMYAVIRAQNQDWTWVWIDLSVAALFLRGVIR